MILSKIKNWQSVLDLFLHTRDKKNVLMGSPSPAEMKHLIVLFLNQTDLNPFVIIEIKIQYCRDTKYTSWPVKNKNKLAA